VPSRLSEHLDIRATWGEPTERTPTTIELAVRKLRTAIILGELAPGQKLVEADLCRDLAISRPSLRETLRTLQVERLIEMVPNRGPFVAKLDARDVEEIHDVWAMLTGETVYRFASNASEAELKSLGTAFAELRKSTTKEDAYGELAATNKFFSIILYHCGNSVLAGVVIGLVSRINFLRAQVMLHERDHETYGELGEIVEAARAHDPDAARAAAHRHIAAACTAAKQLSLLTLTPRGRGRLNTAANSEKDTRSLEKGRRKKKAA
jgi:DNA-binding GntR family transcriptional regulator